MMEGWSERLNASAPRRSQQADGAIHPIRVAILSPEV
jgi:hypothetical protein